MLSKEGVVAPEHEAASPSLLSVLFMWKTDKFHNKNEPCGDGLWSLEISPSLAASLRKKNLWMGPRTRQKSPDFPHLWFR